MAMGLAGLGLAWRAAALQLKIPLPVGEVIIAAVALLWLALALCYAMKVLVFLARRLAGTPFGPACWAFAFPVAALSVAAWRVALSNASDGAFALALFLFVIANAVVVWVTVRTVVALRKGAHLP